MFKIYFKVEGKLVRAKLYFAEGIRKKIYWDKSITGKMIYMANL